MNNPCSCMLEINKYRAVMDDGAAVFLISEKMYTNLPFQYKLCKTYLLFKQPMESPL